MNFLTPELKQYYQLELEKCMKCGHVDWDLDDNVLHSLTIINKNKNIQTTLSQRTNNINISHSSYLQFAYAKQVSNKIAAVIQKFDSMFPMQFEMYKSNEPLFTTFDVSEPELLNLDAIMNVSKYTDISIYMFQLWSDDMNMHNNFWKLLRKELSII
jgi:hypothetical protein